MIVSERTKKFVKDICKTVGHNHSKYSAKCLRCGKNKWNEFIASGTWTRPSDVDVVEILLVGGGGGGKA